MFTFGSITKKTAISIFSQMGYSCNYSGKQRILHVVFKTSNKPIYKDFKCFYRFLKKYVKYDISSNRVKKMLKKCYLGKGERYYIIDQISRKMVEMGINFQIEDFPF